MAVSSPARLRSIQAEFGGPTWFSAYVRGGAYVGTSSTTGNIGTARAGLRMGAFTNAQKTVGPALPPTPGFRNSSSADSRRGKGSSSASVVFGADGWCYNQRENQGRYNDYVWLPAGRAAGEYQIRVRGNSSSAWSAWVALGSGFTVVSASATGNGLYDASDYRSIEAQLGAQNIEMTGVAVFSADAFVAGRL